MQKIKEHVCNIDGKELLSFSRTRISTIGYLRAFCCETPVSITELDAIVTFLKECKEGIAQI